MIYGVYDISNYELCVMLGTLNEVASYFNTSTAVIMCNISRNNIKSKKYKIVNLGYI